MSSQDSDEKGLEKLSSTISEFSAENVITAIIATRLKAMDNHGRGLLISVVVDMRGQATRRFYEGVWILVVLL